MKKFTFIIAALAISVFGFAQHQSIKLDANMQSANVQKAGWHGNTGLASLDLLSPGYEYAIRVSAGELAEGDEVTKVKFYSDATNYAAYGITTTSYTIKIYEGGTFDEVNGMDLITACGTSVYTQNHTASTDGWQEVTLTTPYVIGTGEFWVSIYNSGTADGAVFMGDADASSAYTYVRTYDNEGTDIWIGNEYCVDEECTSTEFDPWSLALYVDDGTVYVENSDLYSMFMESGAAPYNAITEISITGTEDLVVYPAMGNSGPDATSAMVNILVELGSTELVNEDFDMSGENALAVGYFTYLAPDPYSVTLTADELTTMGATGTFDICLTVTYAGVDNVAANNEACLTVTRGSVDVEESAIAAVSVYPNPASSFVTVANAENANIVILNMVGEVVANVENASANQTFDMSKLADGTYFVRVNAEVYKINLVK